MFSNFRHLNQILLGLGTGLFCFTNSAIAAESILLTYNNEELNVPISKLQSFSKTGDLTPQMESFFQTTKQVPRVWSNLLTDEVKVPEFIESFLESPRGRFVLHRIETVVFHLDENSQEEIDTALINSMEDDDTISIMEVVEKYPETTVKISLNELETDYAEVKQFINSINSNNWEAAANELGQEILCECSTANNSTNSSTSSYQY
ncbi:MAG: alpha/beta hydrolase [Pleurocapsa sp. MO_192.B19]|nr:alpha/beta hydrolase [Pleurocapsa sp. MO_192.B19]